MPKFLECTRCIEVFLVLRCWWSSGETNPKNNNQCSIAMHDLVCLTVTHQDCYIFVGDHLPLLLEGDTHPNVWPHFFLRFETMDAWDLFAQSTPKLWRFFAGLVSTMRAVDDKQGWKCVQYLRQSVVSWCSSCWSIAPKFFHWEFLSEKMKNMKFIHLRHWGQFKVATPDYWHNNKKRNHLRHVCSPFASFPLAMGVWNPILEGGTRWISQQSLMGI